MNLRAIKTIIDKIACFFSSFSIGGLVAGGAWYAFRKTLLALPMAIILGISYTITHLFVFYRTIKESSETPEQSDSLESQLVSKHSYKRDLTLATTAIISSIDAGFSSYGKMMVSLSLLTDNADQYESLAYFIGIMAVISSPPFYSAHGKGYFSWLLPNALSAIKEKLNEYYIVHRIFNTATGAIYSFDFALNDAMMLSLLAKPLAIPAGLLSYSVSFYNYYRTFERRHDEIRVEQRQALTSTDDNDELLLPEEAPVATQSQCRSYFDTSILALFFLYAFVSGYSVFSNLSIWTKTIFDYENDVLNYTLGTAIGVTAGITVYNYFSSLRI